MKNQGKHYHFGLSMDGEFDSRRLRTIGKMKVKIKKITRKTSEKRLLIKGEIKCYDDKL